MLKTFFNDIRTQSKTALSFGILLIVLSGLKYALLQYMFTMLRNNCSEMTYINNFLGF